MNSAMDTSTKQRPPVVLILGETLGLGGAEKVTVDILRALVDDGRYDVHAGMSISTGGIFADRVPEAVTVHSVPTVDAIRGLAMYLSPQLVISNNCRAYKWAVKSGPSTRFGRDVFFLHGYHEWSLDLLPTPLAPSAVILTISDEAKAGIGAALGVNPGSIAVIPNAVDTARFNPEGAKADLPWDTGVVYGYAGRFSGEKALPLLVEMFAKANLPDARLLFVGGTDPGVVAHKPYWAAQIRDVEKAILRCGVGDSVHITGLVPNPEDYYRAMDVFCMASTFEGFPLVLLEAMACEVPVISTAVGAIPELLGTTRGLTVGGRGEMSCEARLAYVAAIQELHDDPALRIQMGRAGRHYVASRYPMKAYEARVRNFVEKVL